MTFGQAVKHILDINHIKMGVLANYLGYDISYLSKWVSDTKLPSSKSAEALCDTIAAYVQSVSGPSAQLETANRLGFDANSAAGFEKALSDRLYTVYLEQRTPRSEESSGGNAQLAAGWPLDGEAAADELVEYYMASAEDKPAGLISLPPELLASDFIIKANARIAALEQERKLMLHQLISVDDFGGDVDKYIRYILRHLSLLEPTHVSFYSPFHSDAAPSQRPFFILKGRCAINTLSPVEGSHDIVSVQTRNPETVENIYIGYLSGFHPVLAQTERLDIYSDIPYSFAVQQNFRILMPYMGNLRLGGQILDDFLEKYLDAPHMYEFHKKMHTITNDAPYSLLIYISALIDYINSGNIHLFDGVVTVSREDRRRHLQYLLDQMEAKENVTLRLLADKNPVLSRSDNRLTINTNEAATFASSDAPGARSDMFSFTSPQIKQQMKTFFDHLEAMPEPYIKKGRAAMDFISGAMKLI